MIRATCTLKVYSKFGIQEATMGSTSRLDGPSYSIVAMVIADALRRSQENLSLPEISAQFICDMYLLDEIESLNEHFSDEVASDIGPKILNMIHAAREVVKAYERRSGNIPTMKEGDNGHA